MHSEETKKQRKRRLARERKTRQRERQDAFKEENGAGYRVLGPLALSEDTVAALALDYPELINASADDRCLTDAMETEILPDLADRIRRSREKKLVTL